ncbi:hypothetical protein JCM11641_000463 [Rhodosporidiobolus odoratus]
MSRAPPGPAPPRIPTQILDPPTQRLYALALFSLLLAYKLSDALTHQPPIGLDDDVLLFNAPLAKWLAIDTVALTILASLRIPRLDFGWKARWTSRAALAALDYVLFGHWTFAASFFFPGFLKALLARALSTTERSVRLASVYGTDKSHLGGQYTVHILAVSTAFLNPLSTIYCRHPSSVLPKHSSPEPTLIPLIFNNTVPSKLTYTLTSFDDPPKSNQHTLSASALVSHKPHHHLRLHSQKGGAQRAISNAEDDDAALASEWSLVPSSSSPGAGEEQQQALRHRLPTDSSPSSPSPSDPFNLSPSETLYYLPISDIGSIQLDSILDTEGHAIRIRRKRSPSAAVGEKAAFEQTRILRCPVAGFKLAAGEESEEHRCLSPSAPGGGGALGGSQSFPLGLTVSGQEQPLKVRYHSREGDAERGLKKDEALEGIVGGVEGSGEDLIPVPLNVTLSRPGRTTFYLDAVTDGVGNEITYSGSSSGSAPLVPGTLASRSVVVHTPPSVAFVGDCAKGEDVSLLHGGKKTLQMRLSGVEQGETSEVEVRFTPTGEGKGGWTRKVETKGAKAEIEVSQEGTYEVVGVGSRWCEGVVLVPNSCTLALQALPTLSATFAPLTDVCSSETGLLSTLHLTGAAPYIVHYSITRLSSPSSRPANHHSKPKTYSKRIPHSRSEVRLEPPGPGEWEYRFLTIEDRFYKEVKVEGDKFRRRQVVNERGTARWSRREKTVHECEGDEVAVDVELEGTAPWTISYSVVGSAPTTLTGITSSRHTFSIPIPSNLRKNGGHFSLSLESVQDGHGCTRPLEVPDLKVEVKRTKPTARFGGAGVAGKKVTVREGETVKIPVRLTGEGPWAVTYQPPSRDDKPSAPISFKAQQANVDINIRDALPGTYTLLSVRDQFCPGDVFETSWSVDALPRPTLRLGGNIGKVARNGSVIRPGVCANTADSVPVFFAGQAPFKATYSLSKGSHHGEKKQHTLQAIQKRADLTLFTASPGHHSYHFTGAGDALYPSLDAAGLVAPQGGKNGLLRVEQDVYSLPTAFFSQGAKGGFCVNDELASRASDELILTLTGAAPFEVELEVQEESRRSGAKKFIVPRVDSHVWPVELPFALSKASPYSVSLRRIKDAHGCETIIDPTSATSSSSLGVQSTGRTSVSLSVAEIATITPVSPQINHCVGDFLDFVVMGSPPFTVTYEFEKKQHRVPLTSGKFQRVAAKEGEFKVVSVGHGEDQCRSNKVDIVKHIHPLPSARVSTGDSYVVDIREGEQTEIVFSFSGTPPFSFTYSRRAPQDRSKDRTVLETHTVTGIQDTQYSIFTSQEGTWSVSYIADQFCSYPPAQKSAVVKA